MKYKQYFINIMAPASRSLFISSKILMYEQDQISLSKDKDLGYRNSFTGNFYHKAKACDKLFTQNAGEIITPIRSILIVNLTSAFERTGSKTPKIFFTEFKSIN